MNRMKQHINGVPLPEGVEAAQEGDLWKVWAHTSDGRKLGAFLSAALPREAVSLWLAEFRSHLERMSPRAPR